MHHWTLVIPAATILCTVTTLGLNTHTQAIQSVVFPIFLFYWMTKDANILSILFVVCRYVTLQEQFPKCPTILLKVYLVNLFRYWFELSIELKQLTDTFQLSLLNIFNKNPMVFQMFVSLQCFDCASAPNSTFNSYTVGLW